MRSRVTPAASSAAVASRAEGWRARVAEWVMRYGVAEIAGIAVAFLVSGVALLLGGDRLLAAYAGAVGETAGFYAAMTVRESGRELQTARRRGERTGVATLVRAARTIAIELGPSELADVAFVRPAAMAACMTAFGPRAGLLLGKLAADTVFYGLAVLGYERRRRRAACGS